MLKVKVAFKCAGGYAVGHPDDANPSLCGVEVQGEDCDLLKTQDSGKTWNRVGVFVKNRYGTWVLNWDSSKEGN